MVTVEIKRDELVGTYSSVELHGHIVSIGATPLRYQAKCLACGEEFSKDSSYFKLSGIRTQIYQLYSLHTFLEYPCPADYDDIEECIKEKIINGYIGQPENPKTLRKLENDVAKLLGVPVDVYDTAYPSATLK